MLTSLQKPSSWEWEQVREMWNLTPRGPSLRTSVLHEGGRGGFSQQLRWTMEVPSRGLKASVILKQEAM